jgi:glycosyltransferase involved in cell wall biosynthesis
LFGSGVADGRGVHIAVPVHGEPGDGFIDQPGRRCRLFKQTGVGKGDAVRRGFAEAGGDVLMILDADLTVPPEDLPRFYEALRSGKGEFINGVRLVYPMESQAMRFLNLVATAPTVPGFSRAKPYPLNPKPSLLELRLPRHRHRRHGQRTPLVLGRR